MIAHATEYKHCVHLDLTSFTGGPISADICCEHARCGARFPASDANE